MERKELLALEYVRNDAVHESGLGNFRKGLVNQIRTGHIQALTGETRDSHMLAVVLDSPQRELVRKNCSFIIFFFY